MVFKIIVRFFLGIFSLACSSSVFAFEIPNRSDSRVLTWQRFQAPPLTITKGEDQNNGIIDSIRALITKDLTEFEHQEIDLPYKRFLLYATEKLNVCTPYLFKTPEREKYLIFSKPVVIFPGFEIIMHKKLHEKLNHADSLSLDSLFSKHRMRLATNKVRSYSNIINPIIAKYESEKLVSRHNGSTTLIFRLLNAERADFMVDFPNRLLYWAKELQVDPYDYVSIPIKEDYANATSYFACPKTPWGANVIDRVNMSLRKHVNSPEYLTILKRWSHDYHESEIEDLHQRLLGYYED
ncbi:MAG: TIGR02285 family protein [Methylocystaceae bacterium]|nr:TIGR02285 family protein [Methylocystaceae bacterium]